MSMLLPAFQLHKPTTVDEALQLKAEHPDSDWVAGGTDLLPNYKWGLNTKPHVISLNHIEGLDEITAARIGATARLTDLAKNSAMQSRLPVLAETAALIASPLLRNAGTVGGNLLLDNRCFFFNQTEFWRRSIDYCLKADGDRCHVVPQKETCYATFSADLPGPLIALDAEYELASTDGTRRVKAAEFYQGDGIQRHTLAPGELLTHVHLPEDAPQWRAAYTKMRTRDSWDFPELGIAAAARFDGDVVAEARLVANALEMTPKPLPEVAEALVGTSLDDEAIGAAAQGVREAVRPVRNTSLLPGYRKDMAAEYARRALRKLRAAQAA